MTTSIAKADSPWINDANRPLSANKIEQFRIVLSSLAGATWTGSDFNTNVSMTSRADQVVAPAHVRRYEEAARQVARLWSMEHVEQGWDGRCANPPTRESLKAAHSLIDLVSVNPMIPIPTASVNGTGQSNLFWDFDGFYADVDVDEGKIEFFVKSGPDDEGKFYEEHLDSEVIPSTLLVALLQKAINAKSKSLP